MTQSPSPIDGTTAAEDDAASRESDREAEDPDNESIQWASAHGSHPTQPAEGPDDPDYTGGA